MQFERVMRVVKRYQDQMFDMIEEQGKKSVCQIEVVRVVLQVLRQNCFKEQIN